MHTIVDYSWIIHGILPPDNEFPFIIYVHWYTICYVPRYQISPHIICVHVCIYIYTYWKARHHAIGCEGAQSLALNQGEVLADNRRVGNEPAASRGYHVAPGWTHQTMIS